MTDEPEWITLTDEMILNSRMNAHKRLLTVKAQSGDWVPGDPLYYSGLGGVPRAMIQVINDMYCPDWVTEEDHDEYCSGNGDGMRWAPIDGCWIQPRTQEVRA